MFLRSIILFFLAGIAAWADVSPRDFPSAIAALRNIPEFHSFASEDGTKLVFSVIGGDAGGGKLGPLVIIETDLGIRTPQSSISWINESLRTGDSIMRGGDRPVTPSIIFGGRYDTLISNEALKDYACTTVNCTLVELPGAHALHQERDSVRSTLEDQVDASFLWRGPLEEANNMGRVDFFLKKNRSGTLEERIFCTP